MSVKNKDLKLVERAKTLGEAQTAAIALLAKMNNKDTPMRPEKVSYLTRQINNSRDKTNVLMLMFNAFLSGEGLSVVGSSYQKRF